MDSLPDDSEAPTDNPVNPDGFVLRKWDAEWDYAFIADSWRRSYDSAEHTGCPGGLEEYRRTQSAVIATCLGNSEVLVACAPERPQQILGWVCYRAPAVIHYVFVKSYYRRHGLAVELLRHAVAEAWETFKGRRMDGDQGGTLYTSHTWRRPQYRGDGANGLMAMAARLNIEVRWNPALIFGGEK